MNQNRFLTPAAVSALSMDKQFTDLVALIPEGMTSGVLTSDLVDHIANARALADLQVMTVSEPAADSSVTFTLNPEVAESTPAAPEVVSKAEGSSKFANESERRSR